MKISCTYRRINTEAIPLLIIPRSLCLRPVSEFDEEPKSLDFDASALFRVERTIIELEIEFTGEFGRLEADIAHVTDLVKILLSNLEVDKLHLFLEPLL